jgi:hypothetical protein
MRFVTRHSFEGYRRVNAAEAQCALDGLQINLTLEVVGLLILPYTTARFDIMGYMRTMLSN